MSSTLKTGHIGLGVTDLDRSTAFYQQVLGLEVVAKGTDPEHAYAFLGREGTLLLTLWPQASGSYAPGSAGLHHLSFQVDTLAEVEAAEATLRALGAQFSHEGVVPHGEGTASGGIFFSDPDGIRLEIYTGAAHSDAPAPHGTAPTCGFF
ncbi:VOC family protein [Kitasatospora sp. McL0602]|uniref:VOC family protein n=1 Tax=Kitasatospora sp. McL0602 TaxID=3439530 RepID=UPI003F8BACF1